MRKYLISITMGICTFAFCLVGSAQTEQVTITTYYPAPFGVYKELEVTNNNGVRIILREDPDNPGNPVISLIDTSATGGLRPSITFQDNTGNTTDFRLVQISDNSFRIQGGTTTFADDAGVYSPIRVGELMICSGNVTN